MFDKKTMIRVLMRLDKDEHIITWINKGVYYINDGKECTEETIINYYTENDSGMFIGNTLFKSLDIIIDYGEPIEILSSRTVANKKIRGIKLYKYDSIVVDPEIIGLLEVLEKNRHCDDLGIKAKYICDCVDKYYDVSLELVLANKKYQLSTILKLRDFLQQDNIPNQCVEIFIKYNK